jgi:hypothetical protein
MANDLVVNLGARLDQFQSDMSQAGDIADNAVGRIENSFSKLNPGINVAGLTAVVVGAAAGFTALLGIVASLNKGLDEMARQAERVGLSTKRFQELQFAGSALGVKDTGGQLEAFAQNAQNALSRVNDLKRVFDANNVAITDGNGKIRDMSKLLDAAFDIVKRAPSIGDALQIGSFLGFSKEFSQELFRAGDGFQDLAKQAQALGAVIDGDTIAKASQFTTEWNKAAAVWGVQMKASMAEWLPLLNDAIQTAQTLVGFVSQVTSALSAIKDFAIAPNVDTASLSKLQSLNEQFEGIRDTLERGDKLNPIQLFQASNIAKDGEVTLQAVNQQLALIQDRIFNFNKDPKNRVVITGGTPSVNPGLKPQGADTRDQFEIAVDQLAKRTATLKADTATVFQNSAAQAQLRAEFTLLAAIVRDEGEVTEEQLARYQKLRESMSATQALQASGITLTKEHADAFKSASEGIAQATAEHTKAAERVRQLNAASSQIGSALANSFADAILEGKNLNEVLNQLLKSLARMAINSAFQSIFSPGAGGGVSPILSFFGIGKNAEGTDNWRGGPTWVGEKGPEIVNLPRGSQVIPNAVATRSIGGGNQFTFAPSIDARGADVAAVARIEQVLARQQAEFAANVVSAVRMAKTARVL